MYLQKGTGKGLTDIIQDNHIFPELVPLKNTNSIAITNKLTQRHYFDYLDLDYSHFGIF